MSTQTVVPEVREAIRHHARNAVLCLGDIFWDREESHDFKCCEHCTYEWKFYGEETCPRCGRPVISPNRELEITVENTVADAMLVLLSTLSEQCIVAVFET